MGFSEIFGQDMAVSILCNSIRLLRFGRTQVEHRVVAHAYIFVGLEGVGKCSCAIVYAKTLNCSQLSEEDFNACNGCLSCRKIEQGVHPDVEIITPQNSSITISQIRELKRSALYKPLEGKWKVYIINDIGLATQEAANSLLKIVEEPPPYVQLILIAKNLHAILPTIRSRCQVIRFSALPRVLLKKILKEKFHISGKDAEDLAEVSEGSVSQALAYHQGEDMIRRDVESVMEQIENRDIESLFQWIQSISPDRDFVVKILTLVLQKIRRNFFRSPTSQDAERTRKILYTLDLLNRNVNIRLALENLFLNYE